MTNYNNRQIPTVFLPQAIAPAGKRAHELTPYTIGIIDCDTNKTVDKASYHPDKKYEIVLKKGDTGLDNAMFPDIRGARLPVRLPITKVYKAHVFDKANIPPKNFVAYWGWDGISNCKTISLECRQDYGLQITVRGESIRNVFNRNLTEIIPFTTGCCEDCSLDETCDKTVDTILKALKGTVKTAGTSSGSYYIMDYIDVNKVKSCCIEELPFEKKNHKEWTLTLCDNGTQSDLAKVARQYPEYTVECIGRDAPNSTYAISCLACPILEEDQTAIDEAQATLDGLEPSDSDYDAAVAALEEAQTIAKENAAIDCKPVDYVQTNIKPLVCDECPTCPDTFTKVPAGDKLTACIYSPLLDVPAESFDLDYYSDQSTAQDQINTAIENIAANIPGYIAESGKVLGTTCDDITLQVCVETGTEITEHGIAGLTLTKVGKCKGMCKGEKTTEWCPGEDFYKITRTKCLTVKKSDCNEGVAVNEEHELYKEIYELLKDTQDVMLETFAVKSDNDCMVTFTVDQCSNCVKDGCDTLGKDGAKFFENFPSYKGLMWEDCQCEGWTFSDEGCPIAPDHYSVDDCLCGLKFEGKFVNPETALPCTYDIGDNVEREPIEIEVTLIRQYGDSDVCNPLEIDWTVVQYPTIQEGLGQFVARKEVASRKYDLGIYFNPKGEYGNLFNAKSGYDYAANPNKKYNHIDLYFESDTDRTYYRTDSAIRNLLQLYVESDNVQLLEELKTFFNKTILSHGLVKLV